MNSSADLLLHPVRLRIVKTFLGDRTLTTAQIAAELEDIPKGSLYRHIATLTKAGVLEVVSERRVRGTIEKTYALRLLGTRVPDDEGEAVSVDDQAQAFMSYIAGLLGDFDRYLATNPDPLRDRFGYGVAAMWLTDAEYDDLLRDLDHVFRPRLANTPAKERRRWLTYHVMLPASEPPSSSSSSSS